MGPLGAAVPAPRDERSTWTDRVRGVLADPGQLELVFQPIVGVAQGAVVGYEALSRFPGSPGVGPQEWFAAADSVGLGAELEAVVVARCLKLRATLPPDCFLTVNVSPHLITQSPLADLLLGEDDLSSLVLELTEHQQAVDLRPLLSLRQRVTAHGALLALDDTGSGYSGLHQMVRLRPHIIKLDRSLVADADTDEVKLALAELLGEFAGRIDAWLLAEGVETWGEMEAFLRLGVPLAQGYLLGRPAPPWASIEDAVAARLRAGAERAALVDQVVSLLEEVPLTVSPPVPAPRGAYLEVDRQRRPVAMALPRADDADIGIPGQPEPGGGHRIVAVDLRVHPSAGVVEVARRAVARPRRTRFGPVVCTDDEGRALGIIRVERLLVRLTELKSGGVVADVPTQSNSTSEGGRR